MPQHAQPVEPGQAEVEHHRVVGLGLAQELCLDTVARAVDGVARLGERLGQLRGQDRLVFDDQDPQHLLIVQTRLNGT